MVTLLCLFCLLSNSKSITFQVSLFFLFFLLYQTSSSPYWPGISRILRRTVLDDMTQPLFMMNQIIQTLGQNMIRYIGGGRGHQRGKHQAPYTLQGHAYHTYLSKLLYWSKIQKSGIFLFLTVTNCPIKLIM